MGGYPWVAAVVAVVAIGFFGSILVTPGGFRWWLEEKTVRGIEQGGAVTYTYHGVTYEIPDTSSSEPPGRVVKDVYLIPSKPGEGQVSSYLPNQIVDWLMTAGALAVSGLFIMAGMIRKRRLRNDLASKRGITPEETFGQGIDHEVVSRMLQRQRYGK